MTLQCECGGPVEIQDGSDPDGDTHWESYRCADCGRRGTYYFGPEGARTTGCLTTEVDHVAI